MWRCWPSERRPSRAAACRAHRARRAQRSAPLPAAPPAVAHLPLPQRDADKAAGRAPLCCQPPERLRGVDAGGQHKDERRPRRAVCERLGQVRRGRLHEALAEGVANKGGRRGGHAVGAQRAHEQHALQLAAAGLPLARQLGTLGLGRPGARKGAWPGAPRAPAG